MKAYKRFYYLFIPIALSLIATLVIYSKLPDQVPSHWNAAGEVDSYKPRYFVIFTALLPALFIWLLSVIPAIDPRAKSYEQHKKAYSITAVFVVIFILAIHWFSILASLGIILQIEYAIKPMIGILFIIIGNYLPQAKQNYTYGIRTPWTLDNEEVWRKTTRVGGKGFVICGIIITLTVLLPARPSFWIVSGSIVSLIVLIFLYSYLVYTRLARQGDKP